jgi:cysteine desulfurase
LMVTPRLLGGGQQLGMRSGTEPVVLADNLAHALRLTVDAQQKNQYTTIASMRDGFESALCDLLPDLVIVAGDSFRLPHTSQIAFLGVDRQALVMALDLAGLACSTGSACSSGSGRPSHVLMGMGLSPGVVQSAVRFSFSRFTTPKEVDAAVQRIVSTVRRLRS